MDAGANAPHLLQSWIDYKANLNPNGCVHLNADDYFYHLNIFLQHSYYTNYVDIH